MNTLTPSATHAAITLGTRPITAIAHAPSAPKPVRFAARELAAYLRKSLGVELPIREAAAAPGLIFIATLEQLPPATYTWQHANHDRSVALAAEDHLLLIGENPRSAVYAVYDFLHEFLGIRFFGPGESHEIVPRLNRLGLADDICHETGSAFELRDYFPRSIPTADFTFKNRTNCYVTPGNSQEYGELQQAIHERGGLLRGPGHLWRLFLPDSELFATDPELFALIEGERKVTEQGACFSNPRVIQIFSDKLRAYIREHNFWDIFALWAEDAYYPHYCGCEQCAVMNTGEWFMTIVSEIAKVVDEELPSHIYEFPAYHETRWPTTRVDKLYKNGATMLADLSLGYTRDLWSPLAKRNKGNAEVMDMYLAWRKYLNDIGFEGKILMVEYYNWCEVPNQGPAGRCLLWPMEVLREDAEFYHSEGIHAMSDWICFDTLCWPTPFNIWALHKIWSNPKVSVEGLKDDFYPAYFGPAGALLRAYIDRLSVRMAGEITAEIYEEVQGLEATLDEAAALTADPQILHRIEVVRSHHAFCMLHLKLWRTFQTEDEAGWLALEQPYRDFLTVTYKDLLTGEVDIPGDWPYLWFDFYIKRGPELVKRLLIDGAPSSDPRMHPSEVS